MQVSWIDRVCAQRIIPFVGKVQRLIFWKYALVGSMLCIILRQRTFVTGKQKHEMVRRLPVRLFKTEKLSYEII